MKQAYNPYLPPWEFVPDGEPYVFNDRIYVYGSHDRYGGDEFCLEPYVCWSAPIDNLGDWTYHGIIYTGENDPLNPDKTRRMFAPDVVEINGAYYLYYGLDTCSTISVAKAINPEGPFVFYGNVMHPDGTILGLKENDRNQFDPGIFKDDDGSIYLYSGFSPKPVIVELIKKKFPDDKNVLKATSDGNWCYKLRDDMITIDGTMNKLIPGLVNSKGTGFEGHEFFEASSMRKYNGKYYLIYSSVNQHELCYAMSSYPDRNFEYKGILYSNCNVGIDDKPTYYFGNNHGSLVKINDKYYIFGHRHTYISQYQRQGVAGKITMNDDGTFNQAEMTSCGLNDTPLKSHETYPSYICCLLMAKTGAGLLGEIDNNMHPYIALDDYKQSYIANILDGTIIGYKYFDLKNVNKIKVEVKSTDKGRFSIYTNLNENPISIVDINQCNDFKCFSCDVEIKDGVYPIYFKYEGQGVVEFKNFKL